MSATMTCVEISAFGAPEVLKTAQRPRPVPNENEVLIRVAAAGINRPDVVQRQGHYAPPPGASDLPGLEVAGTIEALGAGALALNPTLAVGQKVCALLTGGGYAEYATAHAGVCLPIPDGLSFVEAASLPETFFTVWYNIFQRAGLKKGQSFLMHGGTSGIGVTAIQLAKAFGATVFATARGAEKCNTCRELGADRAIDYSTEDFVEVIRAETNKRGVDIILDMVGGSYIGRNIKCLAPDGQLVNIAYLQGSKAEVDFMMVILKRLTLTGSTLRRQPEDVKAAIAADLREKVWPLFAAKKIRPVVYKTFPLAQAAQAHTLMEASDHIGKIVLDVSTQS